MEPSARFLEPERGQLGRRRGHLPQISISDDSHHVTEAIGDMYGDNEWTNRPHSFVPSPPPEDSRFQKTSYFEPSSPTPSHDSPSKYQGVANGSPTEGGRRRQSSLGSNPGGSPPPRLSRTNSADTANQHFPLNDIDYESSPAAVAQELYNLQAIRRMSMNVDVADPDLPTFGPAFNVPPAAPSHSDDEDDASRMFWVPARLHPELAPTEFKTFVEDRVERIKRRSGEELSLSPDGTERRRSSTNLSRRKSMLSKTIDSPVGWEDGADVLERKRSQSSQSAFEAAETSLQELEQLVTDPSELVRKMSIDSARRSLEGGGSETASEDIPILPTAPGGQSLKRSTRTNYRRGSLRKGERVPMSRRVAQRLGDGEQDDQPPTSPTYSGRNSEEPPEPVIMRVQTEPITSSRDAPDNFSLPSRKGRVAPPLQVSASLDDIHTSQSQSQSQPQPQPQQQQASEPTQKSPPSKSFHSRIASNGRTTAPLPGYSAEQSVPQIVETPPPHESWQATQPPPFNHVQNLPERKSSHDYSRQGVMYNRPQERPPPARPAAPRTAATNRTLDDMANNPSLMPGTSTRTDALSFIPTFSPTEDKKADKKTKDRRDSNDTTSSRKSSWGWLLGSQNQDSDKDKKDDKESKKSKSKSKQVTDKVHDSTRLDVLNTTADGSRGRESLVLDRESIRLEEERKKDNSRKSTSSDSKGGRDTGIFSSLFGGGKKKNERENTAKKAEKERRVSPELPPQLLRADIDYNWTRFSILEERAIYRMAHIKLANPRRALYSQVLLSNFMYSYLAKVQQMHPQIQIPQFVTQKQGQKNQQEPQQEPQSDEYSQWQRYQDMQQQQQMQKQPAQDHISVVPNQSDGIAESSSPTYIDDYDPHHQQQEDSRYQHQQYIHKSNGYGQQESAWDHRDVYAQQGLFDDTRPPEDDDLW